MQKDTEEKGKEFIELDMKRSKTKEQLYLHVSKTYEEEENLGPPIIDVILNPGDILYIPKMMYHKADPFEKRVSISIPCVPGTPMDRNYFEL